MFRARALVQYFAHSTLNRRKGLNRSMTVVTTDIAVEGLEQARKALEEQADAVEARAMQETQDIQRRLDYVIKALDGLYDMDARETQSNVQELRIGEEKLEAVERYIAQHGHTRQVEIQKALRFNSGTVSVAVRLLERAGKIERVGKDGRSWAFQPRAA